MGFVIDDLPAASIDRLEPLWRELLDHHLSAAPHLASLGAARDPADSWRIRRAQYRQWLADPRAAVLIAQDEGRPAGYAMIRATDAAGSWQWGDRVGILETLVVTGTARGTGLGGELMDAARERLAEWGAEVMTISVIAGNEGAARFYRREGASDYLNTFIMPVRKSLAGYHDDPAGEVRLCGAVLRIDAMAAEKITESFDLITQGREGGPLLQASGLVVDQPLFPDAEHRRVLEVLGIDGAFLVATDLDNFPI
jgi:GNAT superfamily N-acetyltransferase